MNSWRLSVAVVLALFPAMVACLEAGRRLGARRGRQKEDGSNSGMTAIDGAVFGLMGLLIAFTFSGAADRFELRRQLVVEEANAIGTAYLRIDLLPASEQWELRRDFRDYVDARLGFYANLASHPDAAQSELTRAQVLQAAIWKKSVAGCAQLNSPAATQLVLSSLNEMIDITTTRAVALETHPPLMIYIVLGLLVLASSLLAGYEMAGSQRSSTVHMLVYAVILAIICYLILDLEFPRLGFIRVDAADHVLADVRNTMN